MIELHFDTSLIEKEMARLRDVPHALERALYPAVSETVESAKIDLARRLAASVPLSEKFLKKSVKVSRPRVVGNSVEAHITVVSKHIPLIEYDVRPNALTARKGVRSKNWPGFSYVLRSGNRRLSEELAGESLPFIASMHNKGKGGHLGVYRRTGQGQIKELYGPTMQYHATTPEMEEAVINTAERSFREILPRIVSQVVGGEL